MKFKIQKSKVKSFYLCLVFCVLCLVAGIFAGSAQAANKNLPTNLTILYTGSTHAALYHCDCPIEPDGGLARRMSLVKRLRKANPNTILVDAGGFFAGGPGDVHLQGEALDKKRNEINLKGIGLIGYDGLNISSDEFNFGKDYFLETIKNFKVPLVSGNLKLEKVPAYLIKKISGLNVAVIGFSGFDNKLTAAGFSLEGAREALKKAVAGAKKNKADIIILLSYQEAGENEKLLEEISGVDVVIFGKLVNAQAPYTKVKDTIFLHSSWQGRRLGKIDLDITGKKISNFKVEELRLSGDIIEDPAMLKILPGCFEDNYCRKEGMVSACEAKGEKEAKCVYTNASPISLKVVNPGGAAALNQQEFIKFLKSVFPGVSPEFIDYGSKAGKALVAQTKIKLLPAYFLAKEIESGPGFNRLNKFLELKGDYFYVNPRFSGASFFIGREKIDKRLEVFISNKDSNLKSVLTVLKDLRGKHKNYTVNLRFLAIESSPGVFSAPGGLAEVEEDLRQVCVSRYEADKFWNYAICRAGKPEDSKWEDCADKLGIGMGVIKKCSVSDEGTGLLRGNIKLGKDLEIASGPTFVVNNNTVFAASRAPKLSELEEIIER